MTSINISELTPEQLRAWEEWASEKHYPGSDWICNRLEAATTHLHQIPRVGYKAGMNIIEELFLPDGRTQEQIDYCDRCREIMARRIEQLKIRRNKLQAMFDHVPSFDGAMC